jgi:hypothetical protein
MPARRISGSASGGAAPRSGKPSAVPSRAVAKPASPGTKRGSGAPKPPASRGNKVGSGGSARGTVNPAGITRGAGAKRPAPKLTVPNRGPVMAARAGRVGSGAPRKRTLQGRPKAAPGPRLDIPSFLSEVQGNIKRAIPSVGPSGIVPHTIREMPAGGVNGYLKRR